MMPSSNSIAPVRLAAWMMIATITCWHSRMIAPAVHAFGVTKRFDSPSFRYSSKGKAAFSVLSLKSKSNDDDGSASNSNNNGSSSSSGTWMASLKARTMELVKEKYFEEQRWRNADCSSGIAVSLPDWIRRMDVSYPYVACGSSRGNVYVCNLETGDVIATNADVREDDEERTAIFEEYAETEVDDDLENLLMEFSKALNEYATQAKEGPNKTKAPSELDRTLKLLYGDYDGGGTIAIAFSEDLICVSNRVGSVELWRLDVATGTLISQGKMKALNGIVATYLYLDEEYLWVGTANGNLQAYPLDSTLPLALQKESELEWKFSSTILSVNVCIDLNCVAVSTADGSVTLVSTDDDTGSRIASISPPFVVDSSTIGSYTKGYALSVALVPHNLDDEVCDTRSYDDDHDRTKTSASPEKYSLAIGGSDGSIWLQPLKVTDDWEIDGKTPLLDELYRLRPPHVGTVRCLTSPMPGLLISASMDGSMRLWDIHEKRSLYQFVGYKVWLGSLWTDGKRLVSDGRDNTLVMHNFIKSDNEDEADL